VLAVLATIPGVRAAVTPFGHRPQAEPTLSALGTADHRWIGSAVDTTALANESNYAGVLARQFSSVTAENVMKWDTVEPQRGTEDYSQADRLVAFAERHRMMVRGHNLVWHSQLPAWLTQGVQNGTLTNAQLAKILRRHIVDEVSHFRGHVYAWDVVNEPLNEDGTLRDTIWSDALGPGYIAKALEWAHEADPRAKLYLNDYGIEWAGSKSDGMVALAKSLLAQGVPLDGIGFESHLDIQYGFPGGMARSLQRFADLGLDVAVTEADVRVNLPATADELAMQARYYGQLADACLAVRRCVSFTVWGFTDRHSWIPGFFAGEGAADLYDQSLQPKPAYDAVRDAFASASHRKA
jgi:endo-1,4-beta-xylanase